MRQFDVCCKHFYFYLKLIEHPPPNNPPSTNESDDAPGRHQRNSATAQNENQNAPKQTQRKSTTNAFIADQNSRKTANSASKPQTTKERITDWLP